MRTAPGGGTSRPSGDATVKALEALGPLRIDVATAARVGVIRAAFDAVHALPLYVTLRHVDNAQRAEPSRLDHAAGALARRAAAHHDRTASEPR